jgi:hypothetical protein
VAMRPYEGTIRLRLDPADSRVFIAKGAKDSTLTAEDAPRILSKMMEAAKAAKGGLCRWSVYSPEASQLLAKTDKILPLSAVEAALKRGDEPMLVAGRWGKPAIWLVSPMRSTGGSQSKYLDIE